MSIRKTRKDHLLNHAKVELAMTNTMAIDKADRKHDTESAQKAPGANPVVAMREDFLVTALSGKIFDFSVLATGRAISTQKNYPAFTGRHELIVELLPAIRDLALCEADITVKNKLVALRFFWRIFDEIEARAPGAPRLLSVSELSSVHRQAAVDLRMDPTRFNMVCRVFNLTRLALGQKKLHWSSPPEKGRGKVKHLPTQAEVKQIKNALKRLWFGWRDRYDLSQHLLNLPEDEAQKLPKDQQFILQSLHRFKDAQQKYGVALPSNEQINPEALSARAGKFMGYVELCRYFFPDAPAIRAALHLCLATTGWNPAVLIGLKIDDEIFSPHPTDQNRYIMSGIKRRAGGTEQRCDGLKKSQHGPYSIINFLIEVTEPLRGQLQAQGETIRAKLATATAHGLDAKAVLELNQKWLDIAAATRSLWLYTTKYSTGNKCRFGGIEHLTDTNFKNSHGGSFVQEIINSLNKRNPEQPIGNMSSTDFRDAYALHWYEFSGGDILTVMRVLNHRRVGTTVTYTNNVVVRVRNQAKARKVLQAWWGEVEEHCQADPTVVAFTVQHGKPAEEQRRRLKTYRTLMLTHLGTRCSNPHNPPVHVAPHFKPDGVNVCDVQRCMLCVEHAVITPESLDGIARRLAELVHLKSGMSVTVWESAAYSQEMENTKLALGGFEATSAQEAIGLWTRRIEIGEHQVMPFESS